MQSDAEASEGAAPAKRQCIAPPALAAAEAAAAAAAGLPQLEPFGKLQGPVILTDVLEQQRALRHLAEQYMEYSANATVLTEADKQQHSAYEQSSSLQLREAMQKEGLSPPKLRNIMQRPGCPCFCLHHGVGTHYSVDCSVLRLCSTAGQVWQKLLFNSVNNQQQPGRGKMRAAMHGRFGRGPGRGGHPSRGPGRYMGRGPQQVQQHLPPFEFEGFQGHHPPMEGAHMSPAAVQFDTPFGLPPQRSGAAAAAAGSQFGGVGMAAAAAAASSEFSVGIKAAAGSGLAPIRTRVPEQPRPSVLERLGGNMPQLPGLMVPAQMMGQPAAPPAAMLPGSFAARTAATPLEQFGSAALPPPYPGGPAYNAAAAPTSMELAEFTARMVTQAASDVAARTLKEVLRASDAKDQRNEHRNKQLQKDVKSVFRAQQL